MDISKSFDTTFNAIKAAPAQTAKNANSPDPAGVEKAAKEFEAVFVSQMLNHMFSSVEVDKTFGGGKGEEMFKSMMVNEYGKAMADSGTLGIADHVKQAMIQMQETK